ncbi:DUF998 domain-containing protein [Streptosporangium sp. NPDC051023]|uniref:DUF998 domain-containing protein n=1 Tax=Streptosporangium sp. NPDC051023 TaxID=3155410 RepID=UPI0034501E86
MNEGPVIGGLTAGGAAAGSVAGIAGRSAASGRTVWRWPGMAGAALALIATVYAHVAAGHVDPMTTLISDYALLDTSALALVCGTIMLAIGSVWVAYGLAQVDPARSAAARVLFIAGAVGLLLTAAFTTDAAPGTMSAGGEIHRWSAAVVFTALPCAGWMLGKRFRSPALSVVSVLSVVFLATFLAAHPGSLVSDLIHGPEYYGLVQRLLVLSDATVVFLAAMSLGESHGGGKGGEDGEGIVLPLRRRTGTGGPSGEAGASPLLSTAMRPALGIAVQSASRGAAAVQSPASNVTSPCLPMGLGSA